LPGLRVLPAETQAKLEKKQMIEISESSGRRLIKIEGIEDCAESKFIHQQIEAEDLELAPCTLPGCTKQ
jgi:hypothetical protein